MQYTKEQKKELRKIHRQSAKIRKIIDNMAQTDSRTPFSRRAIDLDRQIEYSAEVNTELHEMDSRKDRKALEFIREVGSPATTRTMRHYCDILGNRTTTPEAREQAMTNALLLLFIISRLGNHDSTDLNQKVMETTAKYASMSSILQLAHQQFAARKRFYTPKVVQSIRQNARVRD